MKAWVICASRPAGTLITFTYSDIFVILTHGIQIADKFAFVFFVQRLGLFRGSPVVRPIAATGTGPKIPRPGGH